MLTNDELALEQCRTLLKRATWRLQYHAKTVSTRENLTINDYYEYDESFEESIVCDLYIQELTSKIQPERCRYVIQRVIIEGISEKDVASELHMSQQGVNKWKKKGLEMLRQEFLH